MRQIPALLPALVSAWIFVLSVAAGAVPILLMLELDGEGMGAQARALRRLLCVWPLALLLTLPVLIYAGAFYRWGSMPHPSAWLTPVFFDLRAAFYVAVWLGLAILVGRSPSPPAAGLCRLGLVAYAVTVTLAANDWFGSAEAGPDVASLGLLFMTSQAVLAAAAARLAGAPQSPIMALAGLAWGCVAFTRFLTVWSADKPSEIVYYLHRDTALGVGVSIFSCAVVIFGLVACLPGPFRKVSALVAGLALLAHGGDVLWMVTPSARGGFTIQPVDAAAMLGAAALGAGLIARRPASRLVR